MKTRIAGVTALFLLNFTFSQQVENTEISRKNNADGTVCATHRLCLENKELAVRTESQVRVEWSPGAVLENKTYTMEHTTLLASDHSAVILEGYEYLVKRLADRP